MREERLSFAGDTYKRYFDLIDTEELLPEKRMRFLFYWE